MHYNELGYEEILGEDELGYDEILGELGAGMNEMPSANKRLVPVSDGPWKLKMIGFRDAAIAAAGTSTATIQPSQNFKPARILVPSEIAPFFGITAVTIGPEQMLLQGEYPATSLSEAAFGAALRLRTINLGVPLVITAVNNDAVAHDWKFGIIGIAVG